MNHRVNNRRGVASIIGGVFLVLIIISSYAFFMLSNKATSELQTTINNQSTMDEEKNQESLSFSYIVKNPDNTGVVLAVVNSGSKTITINYIGVNDKSADGIYNFSKPIGNPNINPGDISSFNITPQSQSIELGHIYRIKLITNKGSVFSFNYPSQLTLSNSFPVISLTPAIYNGGQSYILSGSYFAGAMTGQSISVYVNSIQVNSFPAPTGYFSIYLDQLPYGIYTITATDGNSITTSLTVTPYFNIDPNPSPTPPHHITVTGTGYYASSTISILINGAMQVTTPDPVVTDSHGTFTADIDISGKSAGRYIIEAKSPQVSASNILVISP